MTDRVIIDSQYLPYNQMVNAYTASDVVVFPFIEEPGGLCGMEALASRRPIVVYESGYFPYYIEDKNGFIVKPLDIGELYEKTKMLLDDEKLASEMGERGREVAKKYDINVIGEKLINMYREFL